LTKGAGEAPSDGCSNYAVDKQRCTSSLRRPVDVVNQTLTHHRHRPRQDASDRRQHLARGPREHRRVEIIVQPSSGGPSSTQQQ
jgi:hypothetical protein